MMAELYPRPSVRQALYAQVGEKVKDWKVGRRAHVRDNSGSIFGVCPPVNKVIFCMPEKVNLGHFGKQLCFTWGGGFSKYCLVPGEIIAKIHRHALWGNP